MKLLITTEDFHNGFVSIYDKNDPEIVMVLYWKEMILETQLKSYFEKLKIKSFFRRNGLPIKQIIRDSSYEFPFYSSSVFNIVLDNNEKFAFIQLSLNNPIIISDFKSLI